MDDVLTDVIFSDFLIKKKNFFTYDTVFIIFASNPFCDVALEVSEPFFPESWAIRAIQSLWVGDFGRENRKWNNLFIRGCVFPPSLPSLFSGGPFCPVFSPIDIRTRQSKTRVWERATNRPNSIAGGRVVRWLSANTHDNSIEKPPQCSPSSYACGSFHACTSHRSTYNCNNNYRSR